MLASCGSGSVHLPLENLLGLVSTPIILDAPLSLTPSTTFQNIDKASYDQNILKFNENARWQSNLVEIY